MNILNEREISILTMKELNKYQIIKSVINKDIDNKEASERLALSERQIIRLKNRVSKEGVKGIIHKNKGKVSHNKLKSSFVNKIIRIRKYQKFQDFSILMFQEKLKEIYNINISYPSLRNILIKNNLIKIKKRKNIKYFSQRERKKYYGEMVQFDGSYHDWFEGRCLDKGLEKEQCLLVAVDDASGRIYAKFDKNESVRAVFSFWKEYALKFGLVQSIYLDKFSTYKINHPNAVDNSEFQTQFNRLNNKLDIKLIYANSPQAKGRVERMNKTLQDRLVKEMRLKNIKTINEANDFLVKEFIPKFNNKFSLKLDNDLDFHRKLDKKRKDNMDIIFSLEYSRKVRNDFVIQFKNNYLQLDKIQPTTVYKKDNILVRVGLDNSIKLFKKEKELNHFSLKDKPKKEIDLKLSLVSSTKQPFIPPKDHPWRKSFLFKRDKVVRKK